MYVIEAGHLPKDAPVSEVNLLMQFVRWIVSVCEAGWLVAKRRQQLIKILLLIALFVGLFWIIPVQDVVEAIFTADPLFLSAGMLLGFISTLLTAFELEPLTRSVGIRRSTWQILLINMAVKFYTQFSPTTLVGSGLRLYRLAQPGGKTPEALAALAFFRALETFLTLAMGLGFWLGSGHEGLQVSITWLVVLVVGVVGAWIIATRLSLPIYHWFKQRAGRLVEHRLLLPFTRRLEKFLVAVSSFADIPAGQLGQATFWGAASVLTTVLSGMLLSRSVDIKLSYWDIGWMQAVILLATQLPFAFAGGLGIREVTLVALMSTYGISAELALAYSFLLFIRGIIIGAVGGLTEAVQAIRPAKNERSIE